MKQKNNKLKYIIVGTLFILAYSIYIICFWVSNTFGVGLDEIIFTMTSPLDGSDSSFVWDAVWTCLSRIVIAALLFTLLAYIYRRINFTVNLQIRLKKSLIKINLNKVFRYAVSVLSVVSLAISILYVEGKYQIINYINNQLDDTTIYEDYYVDPSQAKVLISSQNKKPKNLIYVYLESMETTYASYEDGGKQQKCYIPNLVELANNNISFSNTNLLGGFNSVDGAGYTMGALMATTSGVPFAFPIENNSMDKMANFASGLTNLGDILEEFGYNQEFLCGSDASFAGRDKYFKQHGNYEIFDLFTAREKGYIADDYFVWWGYEDMYLYQIAKDEILRLADKGEPFNFTMLTVDTHHISGYVCPLCSSESGTQIEKVITCADNQIANFIQWCKEQSFYEDTVIVVTGDHPRMDTDLVEDVSYNERTIYNCFINCQANEQTVTSNRTFTPMDIFPTTLSALGFEWEGNRLGLGTNLFSSQQTLAEELGLQYLNNELSKTSDYYVKTFQ